VEGSKTKELGCRQFNRTRITSADLSIRQTQGPALNTSALPKVKLAITNAPSNGLALKAATHSAEYKRPQGNKAHKTPRNKGPNRISGKVFTLFCVATLRHMS